MIPGGNTISPCLPEPAIVAGDGAGRISVANVISAARIGSGVLPAEIAGTAQPSAMSKAFGVRSQRSVAAIPPRAG